MSLTEGHQVELSIEKPATVDRAACEALVLVRGVIPVVGRADRAGERALRTREGPEVNFRL